MFLNMTYQTVKNVFLRPSLKSIDSDGFLFYNVKWFFCRASCPHAHAGIRGRWLNRDQQSLGPLRCSSNDMYSTSTYCTAPWGVWLRAHSGSMLDFNVTHPSAFNYVALTHRCTCMLKVMLLEAVCDEVCFTLAYIRWVNCFHKETSSTTILRL